MNKNLLNWNQSVRYLILCLTRNLKDFSGMCDLEKLILAIPCHSFLSGSSSFPAPCEECSLILLKP